MWNFAAEVSKRGVRHVAKVFPTQNQTRLYAAGRSVSKLQNNVWPTNDNQTTSSHQNNRSEGLLEIKKPNGTTLTNSRDMIKELKAVFHLIKENQQQMGVIEKEGRILLDRKNQMEKLLNLQKNQELMESWASEEFSWSEEARSKLIDVFKINNLHSTQLKIINATLSNQDVIAIMATGGGKSLCYQLPALLSKGLTLVISPLVSLMEDQVMNLKEIGIEAKMLSAHSSIDDMYDIYAAMESFSPSLKLLYITPEKISKSKQFLSKLDACYKIGNLSRIAIDEVHCIDQWGNDFRPDYKILSILKQQFPRTPILGLSATSTPEITEETVKILNIPKALVFKSSLLRENLFYEVRRKPESHRNLIQDMAKTIKSSFNNQSGIIYCLSRRNCSDVCRGLNDYGIQAATYHAGMPPSDKQDTHMKWLIGEIKVICATVAFGMGINKPDVRFVFHHSMSKSVENYYQESGRAGRDGLPALCRLYYGFSDIARLNAVVLKNRMGLQNLSKMIKYCNAVTRCRHKVILDHFGDEIVDCPCDKMCDHCTGLNESTVCDVTDTCRSLFKLVHSGVMKGEKFTGVQLIGRLLKNRNSRSKYHIEKILVDMIYRGYFREEYRITPYTSITYIVPGSNAESLRHNKIMLSLPVSDSSDHGTYKNYLHIHKTSDRE